MEDKKVCKINNSRIAEYTKRTRSGSIQIFYTGNDERDFERYRKEGMKEMHDKPDTIRIQPPEKHYYSKLINGVWWWVNGCSECNGGKRDFSTYIECVEHDVCRTCGRCRAEFKGNVWGGMNGWQCNDCNDAERKALRAERLAKVAEKDYDEWDYMHTDEVVCPHCGSSYEPDSGEEQSGPEVCEVCEGKYSVETEYEVTYSTSVIGDRITLQP